MADGTYPSCVATLTDPDTGYSSFVAVPSFTIVIPAPRHIASCEELEAISTDDTSYANDYILDNDIDCDGITLDPLTGSNSYIGTFDGGGHQITNFNLNRPGYSYLGLFTFARGATIKDLTLAAGGQITGNRAMGAIAGYADNLTLQNVRSDLLITSTLGGPSTGVGGLVGEAHFTNGSTTTWSNITVNTTVTGRGLEGGAIGRLWIDSGSTFVLEDVQLVDTITGRFAASFNTAGGLIGAANINGPARFLMRRGNLSSAITMRAGSLGGGLIGQVNASGPGVIDLSIDQVTTTGSITGRNFLGGFVGSITASNDGYPMSIQFTRSSAAMDLTGSGGSSHIGGFIGRVSWNAFVDAFTSLIFNHDDASGTIHGTNNIGGFLGGMDVAISSSGATGGLYVYNSTAYATVSGASDVGGFAGYLSCQSQNSIQFPACTFRQDRAIGTVSGDTDIGGFVGRMEGDVDVEDSYTVNALSGATNVGGFVGNLNSSHAYSNMSRVYASTTITTTGESPSNIGGLVGIAQTVNANTNLDHAFAVVSLTDPSGVATNQGWMIGNLSAFTPAHLAYHSFSGPTLSCVGNQSDTSYCTANADPNAFFQVSDEPLSDWAYNTVWQAVASSYPTLLFRDVVTYPAGASYTVSSIRTTENTALINWFTDEHASTNLYYGIGVPTIAIGSSDTPTRVTSHSASLSGLSLCTVYNFLFTSVDVYGTPSTSSQQIFQTGGCGGGGGALTAGAGGNVQMITFPNQVPALPITPPVHVSSSIPLVVTTSTNALPILEHPTSSPACPPMIFTTDLALDAVSPDVQRLQIFLNKRGNVIARTGLGSPGHESTYYGPATKRAVAAFQRANRLSMDGILNAATRERIKDLSGICLVKDVFARDLRLGMRGADVRSLQQLLNSNGFLLATDPVEARANETGYFGRATQNALRALQRARQVPPTGQVDLATRLQLNALIANRAPRS